MLGDAGVVTVQVDESAAASMSPVPLASPALRLLNYSVETTLSLLGDTVTTDAGQLVTSAPAITVLLAFATPVVGVTIDTFVVVGAGVTAGSFVEVEPGLMFSISISMGQSPTVTVNVPDSAHGITPPNVPATVQCTYKPSVSLSSSVVSNGESTSMVVVPVTATFGTAVLGVHSGSFAVEGGVVDGISLVGPAHGPYTQAVLSVQLFGVETVSVGVITTSSAIVPAPNSPDEFVFSYTPLVTLSFGDNLSPGSVTSIVATTVTATFATPVSGVSASDFLINGASGFGFQQATPMVYVIGLTLGPASTVEVSMEANSGSVSPPNAFGGTVAIR